MYTYHGDGVWRMADVCAKEVRNVLLACAKSNRDLVPITVKPTTRKNTK